MELRPLGDGHRPRPYLVAGPIRPGTHQLVHRLPLGRTGVRAVGYRLQPASSAAPRRMIAPAHLGRLGNPDRIPARPTRHTLTTGACPARPAPRRRPRGRRHTTLTTAVEDMSTTRNMLPHKRYRLTDQENSDYAEVGVKPRNRDIACADRLSLRVARLNLNARTIGDCVGRGEPAHPGPRAGRGPPPPRPQTDRSTRPVRTYESNTTTSRP